MSRKKIAFTKNSLKLYKRLPKNIKRKAKRIFKFLFENPQHPSLKVKKMKGMDRFEARIDRRYRFTFIEKDNTIFILTIGPHDKGLGKK